MIADRIPQLSALSSDEKILLAAELWREAAGAESETPNPEMIAALRERLSYFRDHPTEVSSWEQVKARILSGRTVPNA